MDLLSKSRPSLTMLLALENSGVATAIARVTDARILRTAITSTIREKRRAARAAGDGLIARRLLREIAELQGCL